MVENAQLLDAERGIIELTITQKAQRTKPQLIIQKARLEAQLARVEELLTLFPKD
jgi:hypothetical protein